MLAGAFSLFLLYVYIKAGTIQGKQGNNTSANFYVIFGIIFAGLFGVNNLFSYFGDVYGWIPYDQNILAVPCFVGSIVVLPPTLTLIYAPWTMFVTLTGATVLTLTSALMYICPTSMIIYWITVVLAYVSAVGAAYLGMVEMFRYSGITLPLGRPLLIKKN